MHGCALEMVLYCSAAVYAMQGFPFMDPLHFRLQQACTSLERMLLDVSTAGRTTINTVAGYDVKMATVFDAYVTMLGELDRRHHCCLLAMVPDIATIPGLVTAHLHMDGRMQYKQDCRTILQYVQRVVGRSVRGTLDILCDELEHHQLHGFVNMDRLRGFASPTQDMSAFCDLAFKHVLPMALAAMIYLDSVEDGASFNEDNEYSVYVPLLYGEQINRHRWWSGGVRVVAQQADVSAEQARRDLVQAASQVQAAAALESADLAALRAQHAAEMQQLREQHGVEVQRLRQQLQVRADRLDAELTNVADLVAQVEQLRLQQQSSE
jgi:hypothetical protein